MSNETTSTTLSELYTNVIQEALFTFQETSVMRPLVTTYAINGQGKIVQVPVYAAITAAAVAEGTDLQNTAVDPTAVNITAGEIGVMTTLTDLGRDSASRNVGADIGKLFGDGLAKKVDTDLAALFASFSVDVGAATTELTPELLFKAQATLRSLNIPAPYYAVFHPKACFNLKKLLTNAGYSTNSSAISDVGNQAMRDGFIGKVAGIEVYENANIAIDQYDDSIGAVFHPSSIGLAMKADLKIETQRDASIRGTEIVATMTVGQAVVKTNYGVKVTVDSVLN
jgi:hypothetical protein